MKIWQLSPLDPDSHSWCRSDHKGEAIVRAENEREARQIAVMHFGRAAEKVPYQEPFFPWDEPSVVKCIELENSEYSLDGPAELLEPEGFDI